MTTAAALRAALVCCSLVFALLPGEVMALEDPISDPIEPGLRIEIDDLLRIPSDEAGDDFVPIQYLYHAGDGSGRLFVADLRGQVWLIENGRLAEEPYLDAAAVLGDDLTTSCNSCGVRAFAFHPEFGVAGSAGFGKFYTLTIQRPESSIDHPTTPIFRWTDSAVAAVDVVSEWQVDAVDPDRIDPTSEREVIRIEQRKLGHSTEHIGFEPGIDPSDPDFGMLYLSIGDGGYDEADPDPFRKAQDLTSVMGSILEIDPTNDGAPGYAVPDDNPFVGNPDALDEIWAYGFRNPQRFSWDEAGERKLLIADIGQANIEEINLGSAGANYGWREREGTFVLDPDDPTSVLPLPADDARFGFVYPVAQYDHDVALVESGLVAITGGFVYRGRRLPQLVGHYLFADLVSGRIFHVPVDDLIAGRPAAFKELILTEDGREVRLLDLIGGDRVDLRFGQGEDGEIYLLTKQDGMIRTLGHLDGAVVGRDPGGVIGVRRQD